MFIAKALKYARNSTRRKPNTAYVYINVLDKIIYYYNKGLETVRTPIFTFIDPSRGD